MSKTIAVVVHACDRYALLYRGFEYFFKKHWPADAEISNYYFLTEELDVESTFFKNIKTGNGEWSDRLESALKKIPEEYIIYLQEDMWFSKSVAASTVNKIIDVVKKYDVQLLKLNSSEVYKTINTDLVIDDLRIGVIDNLASKYLMSHQPSIWNKNFLLSQLAYHEHPWRNEREGTKRLKKINPVIYHIDLFSENGKNPVNLNINTIHSGAYMTVSVNAQLNDFAVAFINELRCTNDLTYIDYANKLSCYYNNKYTHDGKSKPRRSFFGML